MRVCRITGFFDFYTLSIAILISTKSDRRIAPFQENTRLIFITKNNLPYYHNTGNTLNAKCAKSLINKTNNYDRLKIQNLKFKFRPYNCHTTRDA